MKRADLVLGDYYSGVDCPRRQCGKFIPLFHQPLPWLARDKRLQGSGKLSLLCPFCAHPFVLDQTNTIETRQPSELPPEVN